MFRHAVVVEAGSWYRVDTASGSSTPTSVFQPDGVTTVPNAYGLTGSTVRNGSPQGEAVFLSTVQTLYMKRLTYQGALAGDTPVTSTGRDLTPTPDPAGGGSYASKGAAPRPVSDFGAVDLTGTVDSSAAVAAALASGSPCITLGSSGTVRVQGTVLTVPAGVTFRSDGATLLLYGDSWVKTGGVGVVVEDIPLATSGSGVALSAGAPTIFIAHAGAVVRRCSFTGNGYRYGVYIEHATGGSCDDGQIIDCTFSGTSYGVLKNGATGTTAHRFSIARNRFTSIARGDAIELNIGADTGFTVTDNIIDTVTDNGVAAAGIGIGVAGGSYGGALSAQSRQFTIAGNVIRSVAEGIHIEACNRFTITGNVISGVSPTTDLTGAGVQVYGSTRFTVRGNTVTDSTAGVGVAPGGLVECDRYTVSDNDVRSCTTGIAANCEGVGYTAAVRDNTLTDCATGLTVRGVADWVVDGNESTGCAGHALNFTYIDAAAGGGGEFYSAAASITNNTLHDALLASNVTVSGLANLTFVRDHGNTFTLEQATGSQGRVLFGTAAPVTREMRKGDVVLNTAAGAVIGWLCTASGSQQKAGGSYTFHAAAGNSYVVIDGPGDPAVAFDKGQVVTLTGIGPAGAAVTAAIRRMYIGSSEYRVEITATVTTTVSGGSLTPRSTSAFKTLTGV